MSPRIFPLPYGPALFLMLLLGGTLFLGGCGGKMEAGTDAGGVPPAMSVSEFYAFCSALPTPGACLSDPICLPYKKELTSPPPDLPGCLALCRQTQDALYVANLTNGCGGILERAADLCDQFCRRRAAR